MEKKIYKESLKVSLKEFNKTTEKAWKNYHESKSEEAEKEKQKKIDDWPKAMDNSITWFPKPVKLEIIQVEENRWKGLFKGLGWNLLTLHNLWVRIKLRKQQIIHPKQLITIKGEDTNRRPQQITFKINSREYYTKLFAKKERVYVYKDIITGEIKIKRAKNLRNLYGKVGGTFRIESLGWIPIEELNKMKKTIKELSYENTN